MSRILSPLPGYAPGEHEVCVLDNCFTKRPLRWGTILCLGWLNISELTEKVAVVLLDFASAMITTVSNNLTLFYQKMPNTNPNPNPKKTLILTVKRRKGREKGKTKWSR